VCAGCGIDACVMQGRRFSFSTCERGTFVYRLCTRIESPFTQDFILLLALFFWRAKLARLLISFLVFAHGIFNSP